MAPLHFIAVAMVLMALGNAVKEQRREAMKSTCQFITRQGNIELHLSANSCLQEIRRDNANHL